MAPSQRMITITLTLAAAVAQADNCGTWSSGTSKFKATLTDTMRCSALTVSSTSCSGECCEAKDVCAKYVTTACTEADYVKDASKSTASATSTTASGSTCCSAKATCASYTCGTGLTKKSNIDSHKCFGTSCSASECCNVTTETCQGQMDAKLYSADSVDCGSGGAENAREYDSSKSATAVTTANVMMSWKSTCCKYKKTCAGRFADTDTTIALTSCGTDKYLDSSKGGTALADGYTTADFESTCCTAYTKCSTHTCDTGAGWMEDTTKDNDDCSAAGCSNSRCCKADPNKCLGAVIMAAITCPTKKLKDTAKAGVAIATGATDADKQSACCTGKPSCQTAKDTETQGSASGAMRQYTPVVGLFTTVLAAFAFRM